MNNYVLKFNGYMKKESNEVQEATEWPLYISDELEKILKRIISNPIAKKLVDCGRSGLSGKKVVSDVSFLDVEGDSKSVSYFPITRMGKLEKDISPTYRPEKDDSIWSSRLRQNMTWGKMINKLFPGEFTNMDIDNFYNRFRPEIDVKQKEQERFKVVRGEDIRYWYLADHWDGSFNSCMQGSGSQPFFDIYCNNPEKCGMLIYFSERNPDKIIGRALVWNNLLKPSGDTAEDKNPYTLLDRVYFLNNQGPQIEAAFHKYAIDHKWLYKKGDSFMMDGVRKTTSVATRLKPIDYTYYPYVDTMAYYTPATGRAASTPGNPGRDPNNPARTFPRYSLKNQNGTKSPVDR